MLSAQYRNKFISYTYLVHYQSSIFQQSTLQFFILFLILIPCSRNFGSLDLLLLSYIRTFFPNLSCLGNAAKLPTLWVDTFFFYLNRIFIQYCLWTRLSKTHQNCLTQSSSSGDKKYKISPKSTWLLNFRLDIESQNQVASCLPSGKISKNILASLQSTTGCLISCFS